MPFQLTKAGVSTKQAWWGWMKRGSLVPAFWSFFYLHDSNGAQIGSDARNNAKQADDVMQRMPRSDLFFHLLFANSVQMDPDARSPHFHRRQAEIPVITFS